MKKYITLCILFIVAAATAMAQHSVVQVRSLTNLKDSALFARRIDSLWAALNGRGIHITDSLAANLPINIKWFNPNVGDSVTPAIDAYNAAKAVAIAKGSRVIYFPAGQYPAVDNAGWMPGASNITWKGDGIGRTILLPPPGTTNGGLQMAPYRDAGWINTPSLQYTYEDSAAIGQDYIVMKAGQDMSAFKPGTTIFINDGASFYDQYYGEHNTVYKVQGNRVYLKDNLSRDYTAARGSWAGALTKPFTIPAEGQSAIAYMSAPPSSTTIAISINNNLFGVTAFTDTSATLLNLTGKGNATSSILPIGAQVMKGRSVRLTPSTIHDVVIEDMTVIGRRKALTVSNSANTTFRNVQFKWLPGADGGGLTIDGDDGRDATLDHCSVEAPYYFPSQIARSFVNFKAVNSTFHNASIDFTEFATGEVAGCTFNEGREIDSIERFPTNPAITIGTSTANVYVHDSYFYVSNRSAVISSQPDIQNYVGNSASTVVLDRNHIDCNNCRTVFDIVRNGGVSITNSEITGSVSFPFNVDGKLYSDTSNQRTQGANWFGYINYCKIDNNTVGAYFDGISQRTWHNVAFTHNTLNRLGRATSTDSSYGNVHGNILKEPDATPVQRLVFKDNTLRHFPLKSNSFNIGTIDSLRMDISLNYFYDNVGTGAKDSIVTLFTPLDNRYNKGTGSSLTGYTVNTGKQVQFFENADGTISIQLVGSGSSSTVANALTTTEGQTLTTTEGETIIFN